jgi:exodeoxyribonuclease V gamma subunit
MARKPRAGDPSARQDDRYSFLETILSAREKLIVTYIGRSAVHNKAIPPSVVVSELLDYLNQAFAFPEGQPAKEFVLTEHPLHAFSPRYFGGAGPDDRTFSYSEANAEASGCISAHQARELPPFITDPLPDIEDQSHNLELRELIAFWGNPSQYFLKRRLGLTLWETSYSLDENEPFQLSALERYPIKQELLAEELEANQPLPAEVFEARGLLPPGTIGELQLRSMRTEIRKLAAIVESHIGGGRKDEAISVDLKLETFGLSGKVNSIYGGVSVHFRTAKLNPKDYFRAWIEHLALCALGNGKEPRTVLIGRDAAVTFKPVAQARSELQILCQLYWEGLTQPLRFFPGSAMALVEAELTGAKDPFAKARGKWIGPWRQTGERDNRFIARCFDVPDPLNDRFVELARLVVKPMLQHANKEEL